MAVVATASGGGFWHSRLLTSQKSAASMDSYRTPASSRLCCIFTNETSRPQYPSSVADKVLTDIQDSGIIACLRAQSAEIAIETARAALRGGISVIEVVMSTPNVFEVIGRLVQEYPSTSIGVGTGLDKQDAKDAVKDGANFLMSPVMVKILFACNAGAKIVKVYPVSALGGVQYIAALRKPFPSVPLVVSQDSVEQYIIQGASAVVLSDAIFNKKAMSQKNFDIITQLASLAALQGNMSVQIQNRGHQL